METNCPCAFPFAPCLCSWLPRILFYPSYSCSPNLCPWKSHPFFTAQIKYLLLPPSRSRSPGGPPHPYSSVPHRLAWCTCILSLCVAPVPGRMPGIQWVLNKCRLKELTECEVCRHSHLRVPPTLPGYCRVDSASAEGIPDPSPTPEAGLPAMGRLHFPAIPGKSENPLALTAAATSLSASPACLGAGSWITVA